jgi:hypothetical protein
VAPLIVILRERSDRRISSALLVILQLVVSAAFCSARPIGPPLPSDTTASQSKRPSDSIVVSAKRSDTSFVRPSKSPWLAVGFSAAVPGLGQIYNRSYWKAPIVWGIGGYWVYEWIHLNNSYKDYQEKYKQSVTPLQPGGNPLYLLNRDFYRDQRDKFAWYLGALYLLNLVDAYVDASLYDFDVGPDLTADGRVVPRFRASIHVGF